MEQPTEQNKNDNNLIVQGNKSQTVITTIAVGLIFGLIAKFTKASTTKIVIASISGLSVGYLGDKLLQRGDFIYGLNKNKK